MFGILLFSLAWKFFADSFLRESFVEAAAPRSILFIGDGRFSEMEQSFQSGGNIIFLAEGDAGQDLYFSNRVDIKKYPKTTAILYNLGLNDMSTIGCVQALADLKELGFEHVYFVALGPSDDPELDDAIVEFNRCVRRDLPKDVGYIDSYGFLTNSGFSAYDGIHYSSETYQMWFRELIGKVWKM